MWSLCAFALRDNNNLQQANRKLERKVKEMKMQADEEHINLQSERDQVRHVTHAVGSGRFETWFNISLCPMNSAADSEAEDGQETDGRGRGGDRASGTRQKEAAERTGWADRGQRAASRAVERTAEWDEVTTHLLPLSFLRFMCSVISTHVILLFTGVRRNHPLSSGLGRTTWRTWMTLDLIDWLTCYKNKMLSFSHFWTLLRNVGLWRILDIKILKIIPLTTQVWLYYVSSCEEHGTLPRLTSCGNM